MGHGAGYISVDKKEPKPIETNLKPSWDVVIEDYVRGGGLTWVEEFAVKLMEERKEHGLLKHGVHLTPKNGRNSINDAVQEVLDAIVYTSNIMREFDGVTAELGYSTLDLCLHNLFDTLEGLIIFSNNIKHS